jgi:hypothetical protein
MTNIFNSSIRLIFLGVLAFSIDARAQTGVQTKPPRTMASLMAEGYVMQDIRIFPDKIWMRKPGVDAMPFICERGRIGSPAFEAYRQRNYDEITCSPAH